MTGRHLTRPPINTGIISEPHTHEVASAANGEQGLHSVGALLKR